MQSNEIVSTTEHILTLRNYPRKPAYFLAALEDVHARFGHLPEASISLLLGYFGADSLPEEMLESLFHHDADDRLVVKVCEGPLCVQAGSDKLAESLTELGNITVERHCCIGACHSAPAVEVKGRTIAPASLERVRELLLQE